MDKNIPLDEAYIILVEDDPNARIVALELLRNAGAGYCYARKTADSAVLLAKNIKQVNLFLVDINMPIKSGFEFLDEIRGDENLLDARVVAVSAGTLAEDINRAKEAGFDGFISKPLNPKRFAIQVQAILDGETIWD
ncbi:MAG: response regulator [Chloroflexota bacterium]